MGNLQPRLHLRVAQKQILTPGLVQMVSVLALNKLELKEMINQEIMENPILEEYLDEVVPGSEEFAEEEDRETAPADQEVLEVLKTNGSEDTFGDLDTDVHIPIREGNSSETQTGEAPAPATASTEDSQESSNDPFDDIDFGSFFEDYLDPGYRTSMESESVELPSFENFLSDPTTLVDHLRWQLTMDQSDPELGRAIESILGNLDENGYLTASLEEICEKTGRNFNLS